MTRAIHGADREKHSVKIAMLILLAMLTILLLSETVLGAIDIVGSVRGAGGRIGGAFDSYASNDEPGFIDFFIFAVIFFALCWVAFSSVFKDAKSANVVLSLALGLAFSIALVYGGRFSIKKLLPFAMIILFLLLILGIFAVLKKFVFTKDTAMSKILSFVVAILVAIALLVATWHFICSDNNCENNNFLRKVLGSDSIIGRILGGAGGLFSGGGAGGAQALPVSNVVCGDGRKQGNETCDYRNNDETQAIGCGERQICWEQCTVCRDPDPLTQAGNFMGNNWGKILIGLLVIIGLLTFLKVRKSEKYKGWKERRKKKKEITALSKLLRKLDTDERNLASNISELINNVKQEKEPFGTYRHIVDNITKELKQTIGEEIELIETGKKDGLMNDVRNLHALNNSENALITHQILPRIRDELHTIGDEFAGKADLLGRINELEAVHEHLDENTKILDSFKQFEFREKDVITNMVKELDESITRFEKFGLLCTEMMQVIDNEIENIELIDEGKVSYEAIIGKIRAIRANAVRLNGIFAQKVTQLRYIVQRMEDIKHHVHSLHEGEINNLKEFMRKATAVFGQADQPSVQHGYDTAMYLATHVAENAKFLIHNEMDEQARNELKALEAQAKSLIARCIPKVFETMVPRIEKELLEGKFAEVRAAIDQIDKVEFIDKNIQAELELPPIKEYEEKIKKLRDICDKAEERHALNDELREMLARLVEAGPEIPAPEEPAPTPDEERHEDEP